jgi:hypothetical protein
VRKASEHCCVIDLTPYDGMKWVSYAIDSDEFYIPVFSGMQHIRMKHHSRDLRSRYLHETHYRFLPVI